MRQISLEDLHRLLLIQAADPEKLNPWKDENDSIRGKMLYHVSPDVENRVVGAVLGLLTYQNREGISRLISKLSNWSEDKREINLLDYWSKIGEKYFDYIETFYVKLPLFQTWRRQMHTVDEDLPALAWYSKCQFGDSREKFSSSIFNQWPTFVRGNDPQLYRVLEKGYACLHLHLSGAYPAPYYWTALMNKRFDENRFLDNSNPEDLRGYRTASDLKKMAKLIELARVCRKKLYRYVSFKSSVEQLKDCCLNEDFLNSEDEDVDFDKDGFLDYAQRDLEQNFRQDVCPSLSGERFLIFRVILAINNSPAEVAVRLSRIFWAYVVAKNYFLNTVQQAEGVAGFDYFEHTFRLVKWRIPSQEIRCAEEIGNFLQESGCLVKLELMISPRKTDIEYDEEVNLASKILKRLQDRQLAKVKERCGASRVGLIVHFIKDEGIPLTERLTNDKNAYLSYHYKIRDRLRDEFDGVVAFLCNFPESNVKVVGIDAANRELYCPPEIFGEVFMKANSSLQRHSGSRLHKIGRTFHVGEDFVHLGTGLRRIYEALIFLDLRPGDRLGHASALGIDPERWILLNPTVEMHLIDILDDAVFEISVLRANGNSKKHPYSENRVSELQRLIDNCCVKIYGDIIPLTFLVEAWKMRSKVSRNSAISFSEDESVPAWIRLQNKKNLNIPIPVAGSHSLIVQVRDIQGCEDNFPSDTATRISLEYQHDIRTVKRFLKIETISEHTTESLVNLQSVVACELNQRGIVIESNPSSNWLIGGLESHAEVPAVRWLLSKDDRIERIAFTINPDDPTVFATSIENEYCMVYAASLYSSDSISRVQCLQEIDIIRERSLHASFLD